MSDIDRDQWIAGMRELLTLMESNPELDIPYCAGESRYNPLTVHLSYAGYTESEQKERLRLWARVLGSADKETTEAGNFRLRGRFSGLHVQVSADRTAVCVAKIVGQRTEKVAVHTIYEDRLVDEIEWECQPLMAPTTAERAS